MSSGFTNNHPNPLSAPSPLAGERRGEGDASSSRTEAAAPSTHRYFGWDHLGTVRIETDDNGAIIARLDLEPFGMVIPPANASSTSSTTRPFTGQERSALTGLDDFHLRSYQSNIGRFVRPDNISGSPLNPQSWNLYSYVR